MAISKIGPTIQIQLKQIKATDKNPTIIRAQ